MFKKLKFLILLKKLLFLKFYIVKSMNNFVKNNYFYFVGTREKYAVVNLSCVAASIYLIKKFIKNFVLHNGTFCFVSFNPVFSNLTKQLAFYTNQNYIVGLWNIGFFSRAFPPDLVEYFKQLRNINVSWNFMTAPIVVFISFDNAELFFYESCFLHLPTIGLVSGNVDVKKFSYTILSETLSVESVYFYSRVLCYFINDSINKKKI